MLDIRNALIGAEFINRTVIDAVHRVDFSACFRKINCNFIHECVPLFLIVLKKPLYTLKSTKRFRFKGFLLSGLGVLPEWNR